jgi:hypothetical protein
VISLARPLNPEIPGVDVLKNLKTACNIADCCTMRRRLHEVTKSPAKVTQRAGKLDITSLGMRGALGSAAEMRFVI